jgi:hypothetical protein
MIDPRAVKIPSATISFIPHMSCQPSSHGIIKRVGGSAPAIASAPKPARRFSAAKW